MLDRVRTGAYVQALGETVRADSLVVNIGAGTGLFAIVAAQLGARRVVAIEVNRVIDLAREIAMANSVADRIEFIRDVSTNVTLDEPADIIVSDLHGVLPLFEHHIPSIVDARSRLLKPGGILLPQTEQLLGALVYLPSFYRRRFEVPWSHNELGIDLKVVRPLLINDWQRIFAHERQLVTQPKQLATLDYNTIKDPNLRSTLEWTMTESATSHGLLLWFDAQVFGPSGFSNQPGKTKLIYGQALFPFERPIRLERNQRITVTITAKYYDGDYIWTWRTSVYDEANEFLIGYQQSSFWRYLRDLADMSQTSKA